MMKKTIGMYSGWLVGIAMLVGATSAHAIMTGTYRLGSHSDGSEHKDGGRAYGLRLDGLLGSASNRWTFDFSAPESEMFMTYDGPGTSLRIFGKTVGGLDDDGADYVANTEALWEIDFLYDTGSIVDIMDGGVDDTRVDDAGHVNFGTMTNLSMFTFGGDIAANSLTIGLRDHAKTNDGTNGFALQVGDEDGTGHRGFAGLSGWGWLDHTGTLSQQQIGVDPGNWPWETSEPSDHRCCNDWLFTAEKVPVPEPGTLGLAVLGLAGFGLGRFRRPTGRA